VPPGAISYRVYRAGAADRSAPVILTYESFEAISPECGHWQQNTANTYANRPFPNFGCASQQNLAAMVANPRDLVEPRGMTPADAGRRDVVLGAWRKGEKTQSERSKDDTGQVSEQKQSGG
jgi:pilus assembly protein CpaD